MYYKTKLDTCMLKFDPNFQLLFCFDARCNMPYLPHDLLPVLGQPTEQSRHRKWSTLFATHPAVIKNSNT